MSHTILSMLVCVCLSLPASVAAEAKVQKLTLEFGGATRTYYLFVPDKPAGGSTPLLLLLHGSGRNGKTLIDPWLSLAKSEGIVLVAPDSSNPAAWRIPEEGPDFFHNLVEFVRITHDVVDPRRMYVFGHSAGAKHGLIMGLLESEYFAAVGVHAGLVPSEMGQMIDRAPRKIPMAIWTGTDDAIIPVAAVRQTRDVLNAHGFNLQLTEIKGHTHDYYTPSGGINKQIWAFLKDHKLAAEPKYQQYQLTK
jgi:poly(3-hydroxybutyrate) depolymerase